MREPAVLHVIWIVRISRVKREAGRNAAAQAPARCQPQQASVTCAAKCNYSTANSPTPFALM